jgi:hypothetical protein
MKAQGILSTPQTLYVSSSFLCVRALTLPCAQLWCWIGPEESRFLAEWLTGEYLWIWLALLVSFAVYGTVTSVLLVPELTPPASARMADPARYAEC